MLKQNAACWVMHTCNFAPASCFASQNVPVQSLLQVIVIPDLVQHCSPKALCLDKTQGNGCACHLESELSISSRSLQMIKHATTSTQH